MGAVGSIAITALVVIGTTFLTVRNLNKTIQLQKDLADERNALELSKSQSERLSNSRQEWINNLRNCISEYTGVIQRYDTHSKLVSSKLEQYNSLPEEQGTALSMDLFNQTGVLLSEAWATRTKIKLHLNPDETNTQLLMSEVDKLYNIASEESIDEKGHSDFWDTLERLEVITQKILKSEWERVKKQK